MVLLSQRIIVKIRELYCTTLPMGSVVGCSDSGESRSPVAGHKMGIPKGEKLSLWSSMERRTKKLKPVCSVATEKLYRVNSHLRAFTNLYWRTRLKILDRFKKGSYGSSCVLMDVKQGVNKDGKTVLYFVFEYMETDLKKFIRFFRQTGENIPPNVVKLCKGVAFCHAHGVLHRDLKTHNHLMDKKTLMLKIADLGLARAFTLPIKKYTHQIFTLWYKAPEVLLGATIYSTAVDMCSVGCIFGCWVVQMKKSSQSTKRDITGPEPIADYMYKMGLMALTTSDTLGINRDKLGFSSRVNNLYHTLLESIHTADRLLWLNLISFPSYSGCIKMAIVHDIVEVEEIYELWMEYEKNSTNEAKVVKHFDKIEMIFEVLEYQKGKFSRV
ncbi:hypothetical protein L2E82_25110 [Cichorium intybus]|uniref:Uncharacterized protein n=1 Tax=Cichorium intybus TaxID=13427 RepID=A0ACB9E2X8_CICIN|nr:hypothetical protein L2E82_25110 [Cichorium intybus]